MEGGERCPFVALPLVLGVIGGLAFVVEGFLDVMLKSAFLRRTGLRDFERALRRSGFSSESAESSSMSSPMDLVAPTPFFFADRVTGPK